MSPEQQVAGQSLRLGGGVVGAHLRGSGHGERVGFGAEEGLGAQRQVACGATP